MFKFLVKKLFTRKIIWLYVSKYPPPILDEEIAFEESIKLYWIEFGRNNGLSAREAVGKYIKNSKKIEFHGIITDNVPTAMSFSSKYKIGVFAYSDRNSNKSERMLMIFDKRPK